MIRPEDILEVVRPFLQRISVRSNDNIMAICPFHVKENGLPEQHPSFWMTLRSGMWKCHACKSAGDLRSFLDSAGVPATLMSSTYAVVLSAAADALVDAPKVRALKMVRAQDAVIPEEYLGLFDLCPIELEKEGFHEETLRYFDIGYDTKNRCITYPLRNFRGELIGIRGRRGSNSGASRYKTYGPPEFRAWDLPPYEPPKTDWLWNFHRVAYQLYARRDTSLVVTEGFKGGMWVHQAGITDVVALGGSAMSEEQQMLLERLGATLYMFLDNDDSGRHGLRDMIRRLSASTRIRVVDYDAPQPTDLAPSEVLRALNNAPSLFEWRRTCLEKTPKRWNV